MLLITEIFLLELLLGDGECAELLQRPSRSSTSTALGARPAQGKMRSAQTMLKKAILSKHVKGINIIKERNHVKESNRRLARESNLFELDKLLVLVLGVAVTCSHRGKHIFMIFVFCVCICICIGLIFVLVIVLVLYLNLYL